MLDKTVLISFSGSPVHKEYQDILHANYGHNFSRNVKYDFDWIRENGFYDLYKKIFSYEKYRGYFLWKPIIIDHAIVNNPGCNILYCDSNMVFDNFLRFESIFKKEMDSQGMFFVKHWNRINKEWTKFDTFVCMNANESRYTNAHQVWSSIIGWGRGYPDMMYSYLNYCTNENAVTDLPNIYGSNYPGFEAHRWEQSILSILVERFNLNGVLDSSITNVLHKEYNNDLLKLKEEVDKDPLKRISE